MNATEAVDIFRAEGGDLSLVEGQVKIRKPARLSAKGEEAISILKRNREEVIEILSTKNPAPGRTKPPQGEEILSTKSKPQKQGGEYFKAEIQKASADFDAASINLNDFPPRARLMMFHLETMVNKSAEANDREGFEKALDEWRAIIEPQGEGFINNLDENEEVPMAAQNKKSVFNYQTGDGIEWARWSWNPITGCLHGCEYCYARRIGQRLFGHFRPTFHPERLDAPFNTKIPKAKENEPGIRNVFLGSMTDMGGDFISREWVDQVLDAVRKSPQWTYLVLSKNPARYAEFDWPSNVWLGATADNLERYKKAVDAFTKLRQAGKSPTVAFLSCEPLLEEIHMDPQNLEKAGIGWVIVGGLSRTGKDPWQPQWAWVERIIEAARQAKAQVYLKPNLTVWEGHLPERIREYPQLTL